MPDYKLMYATLFRSMTKAITVMQEAQQATEEMYLSGAEPVIKILPQDCGEKDEGGDCHE